MDRENAREHDGQPDRPQIPPEKRLADEENVEVKRPVIICRVVAVEPVLDHLVDEPAVDSFVEMRRLDSEQKKTEERAEAHDQPRRPIDLGRAALEIFPPVRIRGRN